MNEFLQWVSLPDIKSKTNFLESWEPTRQFSGNDLHFFSKREADSGQEFHIQKHPVDECLKSHEKVLWVQPSLQLNQILVVYRNFRNYQKKIERYVTLGFLGTYF